MILSFIIILAIIGQRRSPIRALQWGQIAFLAGEIFCAINFYIFKHKSIFSEYLHSYGMAIAFGLTIYAIVEGLEMRFVQKNRHKSVREAREMIQFIIPILAALSFIPILSPIKIDAYLVSILGFPYSYIRLEFYEMYEHKILPMLALASFILAFLFLIKKGDDKSIPFIAKVFLSSGLGFLGFSFFRVTLNALFASNLVWFEFWEEATELMFVGIIGFTLWQYRKILLEKTMMLENIDGYFTPPTHPPSTT